jgi:hypothetical protein
MGKTKKSRSGSGNSIPDHISESLDTIFWVKKCSNSLMRIRNLFDPGSGIEKFGFRTNIPDPQHWFNQVTGSKCNR